MKNGENSTSSRFGCEKRWFVLSYPVDCFSIVKNIGWNEFWTFIEFIQSKRKKMGKSLRRIDANK